MDKLVVFALVLMFVCIMLAVMLAYSTGFITGVKWAAYAIYSGEFLNNPPVNETWFNWTTNTTTSA